ncbi:MAG: TROVE domain-containing protein [Bacteroidia bacterium]
MLFNFRNRNKVEQVTNAEGAQAFQYTEKNELYAATVTTMLGDKFYETGGERLERLRNLVAKNDPAFVAKLAIYAREKMYLRSVPLVLTVELAKVHRGTNLVSAMTSRVVQRADEITELLAYYQMANERKGVKKLNKLSKQIQSGLRQSFNKFDEYQFAKYNRDAAVKLRDALFLVHPKAKDETQQDLFNKIANDALAVPYTWETELSALGQQKFESAEARKKAFTSKWEELIDSGKIGYMALLRNMRNIVEAEVSFDHILKLAAQIGDAEQVKRSKQLPFRFLSAYRELSKMSQPQAKALMAAVDVAALHSAANINGFENNTRVVIACDVSGSMQRNISARSTVQNFDIGLLLGMLLQIRCKHVAVGMFGDVWKTIAVAKTNVLANVLEFHRREGEVGYSTNGHLVIRDLVQRSQVVDKVFVFTDTQLWNSSGGFDSMQKAWTDYKKIAPHAKLYLFDLAGYGNAPLQINKQDVFLIAGWSDKIFDVLASIEAGGQTLDAIESIEL